MESTSLRRKGIPVASTHLLGVSCLSILLQGPFIISQESVSVKRVQIQTHKEVERVRGHKSDIQ